MGLEKAGNLLARYCHRLNRLNMVKIIYIYIFIANYK